MSLVDILRVALLMVSGIAVGFVLHRLSQARRLRVPPYRPMSIDSSQIALAPGYMPPLAHVRIVMNGPGAFRFEVNGVHVNGVRRFWFDSSLPHRPALVHVELIAGGGVELDSTPQITVFKSEKPR